MKTLTTSVVIVVLVLATQLKAQPGEYRPTAGDQFMIVPNDAALMPANGITIEAWVYYDSTLPWGSGDPVIARKTISGQSYVFRLGNLSQPTFGVGLASGGYATLGGTMFLPLNAWAHVAATWDGLKSRIYVNGVETGTQNRVGTMTQSTQDLIVGADFFSYDTWPGRMDELRIWSYARSSSELAETMFLRVDSVPGLISAWHFDGDFTDSTGGHDGIPQNGMTTASATSPVKNTVVVAPASAPLGAPLQFLLLSGAPNAPYFFDNSFTGINTGMPLIAPLSGTFPLDPPLLNLAYGPSGPGTFVGYTGYTDAHGSAHASFFVPPFPFLTGLNLYSAFLYLDSLSPMVLGEISEVAVTTMEGFSPSITGVTPSTGPLSGSLALAISGFNFDPNAVVTIGGAAPINLVRHSARLITCTSPPGPALGAFTIEVTNPDGSKGRVVNGHTYLPDLALGQVTPSSAAPGQSVTVTGVGFVAGSTVTVGGQPAAVSSSSATEIEFIMPITGGCHLSLVVANPNGQTDALVMNSGPLISLVTGTSGPYSGGTTCKINGINFSTQAQVTFDGVPASIVLASFGYIEVLSPPGLIGPAVVVITNPDGCTATTSFYYTY